jgi:uncharacterized membrane protein
MVRGTLRTILWVLGSLATLWLLLGLAMLPAMGRMMSGEMMQSGRVDGGMMGGGMMGMMGMMIAQFLAMLGLVGIFVYLLLDSLRARRRGEA